MFLQKYFIVSMIEREMRKYFILKFKKNSSNKSLFVKSLPDFVFPEGVYIKRHFVK